MTRIAIRYVPHSTSATVDARILAGHALENGDALAVAAWYQGPDPFGRIFAELASRGTVDHDELTGAVDDALTWETDQHNRATLAALQSWADRLASR